MDKSNPDRSKSGKTYNEINSESLKLFLFQKQTGKSFPGNS